MKYVFLIALLGAVSVVGMVNYKAQEDVDSIKKAIKECYFNGLDERNYQLVAGLFHPSTELRFMSDGKLRILSQEEWKSGSAFDPSQKSKDKWDRQILSVDVSGTAAMVKVSSTSAKIQYIDYLSLLKIGGRWVVVAKAFHRNDF